MAIKAFNLLTKKPMLGEIRHPAYLWQVLQVFSVYRVILALTFITISRLHLELNFFAVVDELVFAQASVIYLVSSLFFLLCALFFKFRFDWQANVPIFVDIAAIITLMHASGGIISGIGILLIVIVAAHSLLAPGKLSLLSAALAVISLLIEQSYTFLSQNIAINMYTQAGLLGAVILATSFVTNIFSRQARENQLIIENQAQQLATSQQLNAHIVSAMHAGVLVLDQHESIRLYNIATLKLLQMEKIALHANLHDLPLSFQDAFYQWIQGHMSVSHLTLANPQVRLSFHPLGDSLLMGTLVFIYDVAAETRQAQDLKLASLGHLTANIAHELRNPLGAASHAAQLLAEASYLEQQDQNLLTMIKQSCDRMNTVIKNVLSLSVRKSANMQEIQLVPWLETFIKELSLPNLNRPDIRLEYEKKELLVKIDPTQLWQILINLSENGLRYSLRKNNQATLLLRVHSNENDSQIYVDVIDQGEGILPAVGRHIFEPFFTTENSGSGLGLYIAKELSQMNGAKLDYYSTPQGCQFRLTLSQGEQ